MNPDPSESVRSFAQNVFLDICRQMSGPQGTHMALAEAQEEPGQGV